MTGCVLSSATSSWGGAGAWTKRSYHNLFRWVQRHCVCVHALGACVSCDCEATMSLPCMPYSQKEQAGRQPIHACISFLSIYLQCECNHLSILHRLMHILYTPPNCSPTDLLSFISRSTTVSLLLIWTIHSRRRRRSLSGACIYASPVSPSPVVATHAPCEHTSEHHNVDWMVLIQLTPCVMTCFYIDLYVVSIVYEPKPIRKRR